MADDKRDKPEPRKKPKPRPGKVRHTLEGSLAMSRGDFSTHKKVY